MSTITLSDTALTVRLSPVEKLLGLLRDQVVDRAAVDDVQVVANGLAAVRGVRAPGFALPGRRKLGIWRGGGATRLVDVRAGVPALRVRLSGHRYDELLLSTPDAEALASALRTA